MSAPYPYPVDIEVLADREEEIVQLFMELHETDLQPDDERQPGPEGVR